MTPRATILRRLEIDPAQVWQRARILAGGQLADREVWVKVGPPEVRDMPGLSPGLNEVANTTPELVFMSSLFWRRANIYFAQRELELLPDWTHGTAVVQAFRSWLAEGPRA